MKDSEYAEKDEGLAPAPSDRWKSMPDGDAKLAAYLQQAHERARRAASEARARAERRANT